MNQQLEKEKAEKDQRLARLRHANNTDRLAEIQVSVYILVLTIQERKFFLGVSTFV